MEIFMFSELGGGRSRIFYLDEKNEHIRKDQKKPDDNDPFVIFLKLAIVIIVIIGIFKFVTFWFK